MCQWAWLSWRPGLIQSCRRHGAPTAGAVCLAIIVYMHVYASVCNFSTTVVLTYAAVIVVVTWACRRHGSPTAGAVCASANCIWICIYSRVCQVYIVEVCCSTMSAGYRFIQSFIRIYSCCLLNTFFREERRCCADHSPCRWHGQAGNSATLRAHLASLFIHTSLCIYTHVFNPVLHVYISTHDDA